MSQSIYQIQEKMLIWITIETLKIKELKQKEIEWFMKIKGIKFN
jgi:hypothetical protein